MNLLLKHHLIAGWRNILKYKVQNIISVLCLAVGTVMFAVVFWIFWSNWSMYYYENIASPSHLVSMKDKNNPNELLDEMKMHSGTLDFHSHPHNDDCVPSKSDCLMMRKLRQTTGQRESSIVTPNGRTTLFDEHGVIETGTVSSTLDDARRRALMELFGGGK